MLFRNQHPPAGAVAGILILAAAACQDTAADMALDELPLLSAVRELRIGSPDDTEYAFPPVREMVIGPDGSIYSLHRQESAIRRWTPDGRPAGSIGGAGDGPGEFRQPSAFGWLDGELWVIDTDGYRISFFTADGSYRDRLSPLVNIGQLADGSSPPRPERMLADSTIFGVTPGWSDDIARGTLTEIAHARLTLEGTLIDTIFMLPVGRATTLGILSERGGTFTQQPFGNGFIGFPTSAGDGLLVLDRTARSGTAAYHLTRLDRNGDTVFNHSIGYQPVPLPAEVVDSAVNAIATNLHEALGVRTGTTLAQYQSRVRDGMYVPPHFTPVSSLVPGRDGTVWIGLDPPDASIRVWMVLDEHGEPIGRIELPEGLRISAADREFVWGVEQDELDVDYIVRYALTAL